MVFKNVVPDPKYNCGPYKPLKIEGVVSNKQEKYNKVLVKGKKKCFARQKRMKLYIRILRQIGS